jgi:hypothetical protein
MSLATANPHCVQCEKYSHWIEILVRDEWNKPFNGVTGQLIDASGASYSVTLSEQPILLTHLAPGPVSLVFDYPSWLKEAQSQVHRPNQDTMPNVDYAAQYVGYQSSKASLVLVTTGDLTQVPDSTDAPEKALPERHLAGQADPLSLITDSSYVLEVRAFNYITLRLGMFFDGTANNTYSAQWGKNKHDAYMAKWKGKYDTDKGRPSSSSQADVAKYRVQQLSDKCFETPQEDTFWIWEDKERVESSASNELTNVQKLYDRYILDQFNEDASCYFHSEYITGIGTGNETEIKPAKESTLSQGFGTGEYGVISKVDWAVTTIQNTIPKVLNNAVIQSPVKVDGFDKLEFDVFGFSRGSAAARHFINTVLEPDNNMIVTTVTNFCIEQNLSIPNAFDWTSNDHCEITFAGLFDTVAAIVDLTDFDFSPHNDDNGDVKLWLDPKRVRHAVHLTANDKTEYRKFFSLNKLNRASHFHEFVLPGAHSDIGGGYHSKMSFTDNNYLLPRLENKVIKIVRYAQHDFNEQALTRRIERELSEAKAKEIAVGWHPDDLVTEIKLRHLSGDKKELIGRLSIKRVVEGDLSRLYLRVMYGLAENLGVPLTEINEKSGEPVWEETQTNYYAVSTQLAARNAGNPFSFASYCAEALSMAKAGNISTLKTQLESAELLQHCMAYNLVHHSSSTDISGHPFSQHGVFQRARYDCQPS